MCRGNFNGKFSYFDPLTKVRYENYYVKCLMYISYCYKCPQGYIFDGSTKNCIHDTRRRRPIIHRQPIRRRPIIRRQPSHRPFIRRLPSHRSIINRQPTHPTIAHRQRPHGKLSPSQLLRKHGIHRTKLTPADKKRLPFSFHIFHL